MSRGRACAPVSGGVAPLRELRRSGVEYGGTRVKHTTRKGRNTACTSEGRRGFVTKKLMTLVFAVTTALGPTWGLLRPVPAMAQEEGSAQPKPAASAVTPEEGPDTRPQKSLSLQEALTTAVSNNLTVAIRRKDPEIADL